MGQVHTQFSLYNIKDVCLCYDHEASQATAHLNTIIVIILTIALAHVTKCL